MEYKYLERKLQDRIESALKDNPLVMGDLLKFIGDYTANFEKALDNKRNAEAKQAVYDLLMNYKIPQTGIPKTMLCNFIEPIRALWPTGYNSGSHSVKSRLILDSFVEAAKREGWTPECDFIKEIREFDVILKLLYEQYESSGKSHR